MHPEENALLLFVRLPRQGTVKSRLAAGLAEHMDQDAANALTKTLYTAFVEDLMYSLASVPATVQLWLDPGDVPMDDAADEVQRWLSPIYGREFAIFQQQGDDLGTRMRAAFESAFAAGVPRALLMGSDVPDYSPKVVEGAFEVLHRVPVVVGPALDGGYYAIGFERSAFLPGVFEGMDWGTDGVFKATMAALSAQGHQPLLLPEWNDVDDLKDLNVLYRSNRQSSFNKSRTYGILQHYADLLATYDMDLPDLSEVIGPAHVLARLKSMGGGK